MPEPETTVQTPWMRYEAAARYIGVALGTLRNLVSQGRVPFVKRRGIVRFNRRHLDQWLARGLRRPKRKPREQYSTTRQRKI